jgi:hypothetical protein
VRIFSVSYNAHVLESPPPGHASHVANNVYQTLIDPRYKSPFFDCHNVMFGQIWWFRPQIYQATTIFRFFDLLLNHWVISQSYRKFVHLSMIVCRPTIDGVSTLPENWTYHSNVWCRVNGIILIAEICYVFRDWC